MNNAESSAQSRIVRPTSHREGCRGTGDVALSRRRFLAGAAAAIGIPTAFAACERRIPTLERNPFPEPSIRSNEAGEIDDDNYQQLREEFLALEKEHSEIKSEMSSELQELVRTDQISSQEGTRRMLAGSPNLMERARAWNERATKYNSGVATYRLKRSLPLQVEHHLSEVILLPVSEESAQ